MQNKLSKDAYGGVSGKDYKPFLSEKKAGSNTIVLVMGILLAVLFAASTTYSGMKSGLTVAAGIPGSIIGSGLISAFAKNKGVLGKNILQGMSSGGESIASGIIFVLPAVILAGSSFTFLEGILVGTAGTLFGIGVSALVYNYLIVDEHGSLAYPEAMAISETLVASEGAGESMKFMGIGFVIGGIVTTLSSSVFNLVNTVFSLVNEKTYKWQFQMDANPLLLGIGFIVGMDVSLMMFAGSIFANFAVMPLIGYFAEIAHDSAFIWNNPSTAINAMGIGEISGSYVKYIGAGMMLSGGIISAIKLLPTIYTSLKATMKGASGANSDGLSKVILLVGAIGGFAAGFFISEGNMVQGFLGAFVSLVLSFLFVIVSGRLTGTIGTSNLPVSGMTIASMVILTLSFVIMGWSGASDNKVLLLFGTFIVVAIATAGGYTQTQKVNFVIGGDKKEVDKTFAIATVVGVVTVIGVILLLAPQLAITENAPFALPQANLISTLTTGITSGNLPWNMIIVGAVLGLVLFLLGLPVMTVAIGFYLPIATTSIILLGAIVRFIIEKISNTNEAREARVSNGISLSSGLVAGGSIIGLIGIVLQVFGIISPGTPQGLLGGNVAAIGVIVFLFIASIIPIYYSYKNKA